MLASDGLTEVNSGHVTAIQKWKRDLWQPGWMHCADSVAQSAGLERGEHNTWSLSLSQLAVTLPQG